MLRPMITNELCKFLQLSGRSHHVYINTRSEARFARLLLDCELSLFPLGNCCCGGQGA